jgi:hypothetical protein
VIFNKTNKQTNMSTVYHSGFSWEIEPMECFFFLPLQESSYVIVEAGKHIWRQTKQAGTPDKRWCILESKIHRETHRVETQAGVLCYRLEAEFLLFRENLSFFFLRLLADWIRPAHIIEGIYLTSTDWENLPHLQNTLQQYLDYCLTKHLGTIT